MDGNIITSIVESKKVHEGDTLLVVDGDGRKRACGQFFFAFVFFFVSCKLCGIAWLW
jgi:hypothetical protein